MKKADLNLLVIFDAIMREGSITRAAEQLAMTQPAVSNAVSRMRIAWNDPVFSKQGRGITPTPHAQVMWQQMRPHLDGLREMTNPEPFDAANARRTFRIGAADFNLGRLWRKLGRRAERLAPGIDFHAVPIATSDPKAQLVNAEVDLSIAPLSVDPSPHIRREALLDSYFVCAMRRDHPLAVEPLSLDAFAAANHLLVSLSGDATGIVDELLLAQGLDRRVSMTANDFSLVATLLKETDLISTVPYEVVAESAYKGELRVMRPPVDMPPINLSLVWHERSDRDAGHRWLRDQMQAVAQETRRELPIPACVRPASQPPGGAAGHDPATNAA